jgi:hypothetical protein
MYNLDHDLPGTPNVLIQLLLDSTPLHSTPLHHQTLFSAPLSLSVVVNLIIRDRGKELTCSLLSRLKADVVSAHVDLERDHKLDGPMTAECA